MSEREALHGPRERISDRVTAAILKKIASGEVGPGQSLPAERKLASELNVSRVSVRAALQSLKAQGFLTSVQGGGTRVVSNASSPDPALAELVRLDRSNMRDLMDLRCEIEVWAARRAAENATDEGIAELRDTLAAMDPDCPDKAAADVAFHMAIAKSSDSAVYRHLLGVVRGTLTEMLTFHRTELFATAEDDRTVMAHHTAIVDAIEARDPDAAARAMRRHLIWARDHYESRRPVND